MARSKPFIELKMEGDDPRKIVEDIANKMTRAMKIAAEKTATELRDSLEMAVGHWNGNIGWTGALYNSIEARHMEYSQKSQDYVIVPWGIVMWDYGWELDRGSGRQRIHPGTKLATWASAHSELWGITAGPNSKLWEGKEIAGVPHYFIDQGIVNYQTHLDNALEDG
jgi:hypothetical protein